MKSKFLLRISSAVICIAAAWILAMSLMALFANGTFYHVEQPVPVLRIQDDEVVLWYARYSRYPMSGTCSNELQCTQLYPFGERGCPLEKGYNEFMLSYPLPESAEGECRYRGTVEYYPLRFLGPQLSYEWESEVFTIPEKGK